MNHLKILKQTVTGLILVAKKPVLGGFSPVVQISIILTTTNGKKLDAWTSTLSLQKKHMPKAEKIVWDRELNREVQLGETSKMSRSILKLKKKKQKK